jgi:competence protein ComEC
LRQTRLSKAQREESRSFVGSLRLAVIPLLALFCASSLHAQTQETVVPSDRVTTFVHIRSAPRASSTERGRLQIGDSLPLIQSVPRWYEVRLPDGTTGFVGKAWTTVTHPLTARAENELRIHFLNIGTGTCTVVECPGPSAPPMIVDCGSLGRSDDDLTSDETRTYVQTILAGRQPNVVISHANRDHYSYIADILASSEADHIWQGGVSSEYVSDDFPTWINKQEMAGATIHVGLPDHWHNDGQPIGAELSCGTANTYVLTMNTGDSKNAQSLVLMIEPAAHTEFTAILTGDAEGVTESQAVNNFANNLKATVVAGSHHGANTHGSNGASWITATAPDVVIFSAGERFGHPRCAAVDRITTSKQTLEHEVRCGVSNTAYGPITRTRRAHYMTAVSGTVIVASDGHSPMSLHCTRTAECGVKIAH